MSDLIPADSWHRYGYALYPDQAWEIGDGGQWGSIAEPSIVRGDTEWQMWYTCQPYQDLAHSAFHNQGFGMGYATAPTSRGPWAKYVPELVDEPLTDPSFETDGGGGVATGWTLYEDVGGTPTTTLVAGRTGGNAQRIQYTLQAGDAGKTIWLVQTVAAGVARNEAVHAAVWAKGALTGSCTVCIEPTLAGSNEFSSYTFAPTSGWVHIVPSPPLHRVSEAANGNVNVRIIRAYCTGDSGSVDITIDDATLSHGITSPVKPSRANQCVVRVDGTYHWFGHDYATGISQASSADGITWGAETLALPFGNEGAWDHVSINNSRPFRDDDGIWYLYYDGYNNVDYPGTNYTIGVATAPDITGPWTRYAGNPLIPATSRVLGHPCVLKIGGQYLMYAHGHSVAHYDTNPGDSILRFAGTSPLEWVIDQDPVFTRVGEDEGEGLAAAQAADASVYHDGYKYVMLYTANFNEQPAVAPSHTKIMLSDAQLPDTLPSLAEAVTRDITIFAEDTAPILLTLPCDLSGCSVAWGASATPGQAVLVSAAAQILDATAGICMVELDAVDTAGLAGLYYYEAEVTDPMGVIKTLLSGRLLVRPDTV